MTQAPRILFVCDAGAAVGGGHVMRSLTLAQALGVRGAACTFLAPSPVGQILDSFAPEMTRAPAASTAPADLIAAAAEIQADALVFDHYGLDAVTHLAIASGRPTLAIDDLADRKLNAGIVVDSGPTRRVEDYKDLVSAAAQLLVGPAYAPVRPEFATLRAKALTRRGGPVRRVMVSLGLTDVGAITSQVAAQLAPCLGDAQADIVVGEGAPSLPWLKAAAAADPRLKLHIDTRDMARLTLEADIAVGAAGSTTWERCVLGLPSLLVVLADNQRAAAGAMDKANAALVIEAGASSFQSDFIMNVQSLLTDAALRRRLSHESAGICDGLGAERVAEAFLSLIAGCDIPPPQP